MISKLVLALLISTGVQAKPSGIPVGKAAPDFSIELASGDMYQLSKEATKAPQVLVFYRGGWCPYCNLQLQSLNNSIAPGLKKMGVKMIAISVDQITEGKKSAEKLSFHVASDSKAEVIELYNIVNQTDAKLRKKYKDYKIDLKKASGQTHYKIAIPAVFVVDKKGVIRFSYANENYKVRAQTEDILKAVKAL